MTVTPKQEKLYNALTAIDDTFLEEVFSSPRSKTTQFLKRLAAVAAAAAILVLLHIVPSTQNPVVTDPNNSSHTPVPTPLSFFAITVHANDTLTIEVDPDSDSSYYSSITNNGAITSDTFYSSNPEYIYDPETGEKKPYTKTSEQNIFMFDVWPSENSRTHEGLHFVVEYNGKPVSGQDEHISPGFLMQKDENGNILNGYYIKGWFHEPTEITISLFDEDDLLLQKTTLLVTFAVPADEYSNTPESDQMPANGYIIEVVDQYYFEGGSL